MDLALLADMPAIYKALVNPVVCVMIVTAIAIGLATGWRRK